jgi:hypothetical protein
MRVVAVESETEQTAFALRSLDLNGAGVKIRKDGHDAKF